MSTNEGSLPSPPLPDRSSPVQTRSANPDSKMACLLTLNDGDSNWSSPAEKERSMDYQQPRDLSGRLGGGNGSTPNGHIMQGQRESSGTPSSSTGSGNYYPAPPAYNPNVPLMHLTHGFAHRPQAPTLNTGVPLSTIVPGSARPSEAQLNVAYGYGIQREDGSVIRLIPADEIANFHMQVRQGPEGLIILPLPRQQPPERRFGHDPLIPHNVIPQLNPGPPGTHGYDTTQMQIDTIVAQSMTPSSMAPPTPTPPGRREKIYCDKWIHEGVCAFTQMGCKYKHEMPMDRATQLTLGLNHGLPNWYRRAYALNLTPATPPGRGPSYNTVIHRHEGPWRRHQQESPEENVGSETNAIQAGRTNGGIPDFGIIGARPNQGPLFSINPYLSSKTQKRNDEDEDDEDGTVTYRGRGN